MLAASRGNASEGGREGGSQEPAKRLLGEEAVGGCLSLGQWLVWLRGGESWGCWWR